MSPHEFPIPVHDLDASGKAYRFPIRREWVNATLEAPDVTAGPTEGELEVRVSKSGNDVVVHGKLRAELAAPCGRCLEPTVIQIDQPLSALMVPASEIRTSKGEDDEYEFSKDEADVLPYDGDTVVLDDLVRDELLLEVPMIPLCSDDCPGISPPPGVGSDPSTKNAEVGGIDPRLAPLLELKLGKTEKKNKKE